MLLLGVPAFTVLFWTGPFVSAAAVVWSDRSAGWRALWIALVPVFIAVMIIALASQA